MASKEVLLGYTIFDVYYDYEPGEDGVHVPEGISIYKICHCEEQNDENLLNKMSAGDLEEIEQLIWLEIEKE